MLRVVRKISRSAAFVLVTTFVLAGGRTSAHGGIAERIAVLDAQIAQHPTRADLFVRRADLYRESRRWNDALADLDRAERIDRTLASPPLVRAHLHLDREQWQSAVDAATAVLARQANNVDALVVRARASTRLKRADAAAADYSAALALQPLPDLYLERARVFASAPATGPERALRSLDEGIAQLGPIVTLELAAIDLELRLERYDRALARIDAIAVQTTRKESWLARRGAVLERAGRRGEALAAYRAALDAAAALPDRLRKTAASMALVAEVRADITRLEPHVHLAARGGKESR